MTVPDIPSQTDRRSLARSFAVSPCSNFELPWVEAMRRYAELGFRKFETFNLWTPKGMGRHIAPAHCRAIAQRNEMQFISMHLPPINDDRARSLEVAIEAARFAQEIGAKIVLFKATSLENYIATGRQFLDAIDGLNVTPVVQNHYGQAISTLDHFRKVLKGIDDSRLRTLLEVGHFHSAGVAWREAFDLLGPSVALVHIKDQIGRTPVPFGTGEIDFSGLFQHMANAGYDGDYVVEMEAAPRQTARTIELLGQARSYLEGLCNELNL